MRENKNIVIKKVDKSSMYVIMNNSEYLEKLNNILKDTTKLKKK